MKTRILLFMPFLFLTCTFAQDDHPAPPSGRGWLGVSTRDMTPRLAKEEEIKIERGAYVNEVLDESPADKAGLKEGDVILEFNGKKVDDADDLVDAVRETSPGSTVSVAVFRSGENKSFQVTVGKARHERLGYFPIPRVHPEVHVFSHRGYSGLHLMNMSEQLAEYFGAPEKKGVLVNEVDEGSAAEKAGFKAGDIIVKAGDFTVGERHDIDDALDDVHAGDKVEFGVLRKGASMTLTLVAEKQSHGFRFRSEDFPEMNERFHLDLDKFKMEMKSLGKTIQEEMHNLREKLHDELHTVWS